MTVDVTNALDIARRIGELSTTRAEHDDAWNEVDSLISILESLLDPDDEEVNMTADIVTSTEMLNTLWRAQLAHAIHLSADALQHGGTGDDGHDYLTAALDLASLFQDMHYDDDYPRLAVLLNTRQTEDSTDTLLDSYATDGICPEIWALKPPALNT